MRAAIRVDASAQIGTGHLKRSLSLAKALRGRSFEVILVARDLGIDLAASARESGFRTITLSAPGRETIEDSGRVAHARWAEVSWRTDAEEVVGALLPWRPDLVIVDHYAFDACWHEAIRTSLHCKVAVIDDLADRDLAADLIVDHNYSRSHQQKFMQVARADALLLGGPQYALLGQEYENARRYRIRDSVESIGIFMGGIDLPDLTSMAMTACRQRCAFEGAIEIATTSANPHMTHLREVASSDGRTRISTDQPNLADFFSRHDIQIGAAGGATWERCCIGAPTVALISAENQKSVLLPLAALNVLAPVMEVPPTDEGIGQVLEPLIHDVSRRAALSRNASALVDGRGAERVAEALAELCKA